MFVDFASAFVYTEHIKLHPGDEAAKGLSCDLSLATYLTFGTISLSVEMDRYTKYHEKKHYEISITFLCPFLPFRSGARLGSPTAGSVPKL